jgi:hypothetical protein
LETLDMVEHHGEGNEARAHGDSAEDDRAERDGLHRLVDLPIDLLVVIMMK